jgi:DNA-binding NtrC family response regulator
MKSYAGTRNAVDPREVAAIPRSVATIRVDTPAEVQPTFTLTFTLGAPMREISDTVIRTVLQYARGNRLRAAQLLKINPRTIRRRLGKKEGLSAASLAA